MPKHNRLSPETTRMLDALQGRLDDDRAVYTADEMQAEFGISRQQMTHLLKRYRDSDRKPLLVYADIKEAVNGQRRRVYYGAKATDFADAEAYRQRRVSDLKTRLASSLHLTQQMVGMYPKYAKILSVGAAGMQWFLTALDAMDDDKRNTA